VDVTNSSERVAVRLVVGCELLDSRGLPVGTGLGAVRDLKSGESQTVKTVIFGVRSFSSARALVNAASFQ
jgi:hypothetical protein